jgi:hypothetical protein
LKGDCVDTPVSCAVILSTGKSTGDGPYLINPTGTQVVDVYCDMTDGGITYEQLAFGQYTGSYAGYTMLSATDLQNPRVQQAFIWSYNKQGGMKNLAPGFTSGNCCFKGNTDTTTYLMFNASYLYPANGTATGSSFNCGGPYSETVMRFYLNGSTVAVPPLSTAYFTSVTTTTACNTSGNPAFFFKKY